MTTEGGDVAAPLTQADIPELVKAVADALAKPTPDNPGTSGGKLLTVLATARSYTFACSMWTVYLAVGPGEQLGALSTITTMFG